MTARIATKPIRKDFLDPNQSYRGISTEAPHLGGFVEAPHMTGTWVPWVWELIIEAFKIKTMTDVGAGDGQVARWFAYSGIDAMAVDGCENLRDDGVRYVQHDYSKGEFVPPRRDLCWSAEFVEHVNEEFVPNFLATFRQHRFLALTHAFPGHAGYHHVNCREPSYWLKLLAADGWTFDAETTHDLRCVLPRDDFPGRCVKESLLFFRRA